MTREEAKERLQKIRHEYTFNSNKEATQNLKALHMAIEALQWQDRILTQIEDIVLKEHGEKKDK